MANHQSSSVGIWFGLIALIAGLLWGMWTLRALWIDWTQPGGWMSQWATGQ